MTPWNNGMGLGGGKGGMFGGGASMNPMGSMGSINQMMDPMGTMKDQLIAQGVDMPGWAQALWGMGGNMLRDYSGMNFIQKLMSGQKMSWGDLPVLGGIINLF